MRMDGMKLQRKWIGTCLKKKSGRMKSFSSMELTVNGFLATSSIAFYHQRNLCGLLRWTLNYGHTLKKPNYLAVRSPWCRNECAFFNFIVCVIHQIWLTKGILLFTIMTESHRVTIGKYETESLFTFKGSEAIPLSTTGSLTFWPLSFFESSSSWY